MCLPRHQEMPSATEIPPERRLLLAGDPIAGRDVREAPRDFELPAPLERGVENRLDRQFGMEDGRLAEGAKP